MIFMLFDLSTQLFAILRFDFVEFKFQLLVLDQLNVRNGVLVLGIVVKQILKVF